MQYKGAVFFDYDGTLTDEHAGILKPTEATREAIRKLRENGYLAILATGRAIPYIYDMGVEFDGMSTSNGTYGVVAGEVIFDHIVEFIGDRRTQAVPYAHLISNLLRSQKELILDGEKETKPARVLRWNVGWDRAPHGH